MPKIAAANKGEKITFSTEEQATLKNAAAAAQKFQTTAALFTANSQAALATQLNNAKGIQTTAAKYASAQILLNPNPLQAFANKIEQKYIDLNTQYDTNFLDKYNRMAYDKVAVASELSIIEKAFNEWEDFEKEIDNHKKNNPSLYIINNEDTKRLVNAINARKSTASSRKTIVESTLMLYKKGIIDTESRFNSKLLVDSNAENITGIAADYNDPEIKKEHRNPQPKSNVFKNDVLSSTSNDTFLANDSKSDNDFKDIKEIPLVTDGISAEDVTQGSIGNCYFLGSLASVADSPKYRDMLAKNIEKIHNNLYEVTLYVKTLDENGKPTERKAKKIRVDTDFPVDENGNIRYAQIKGDMWAAIVEKAFAKEFGGYDDISDADTAVGVLAMLTNSEPVIFSTSTIISDKEVRAKFIAKMQSKDAVMTFTTEPFPKGNKVLADGQIVISHHAYGFLSYNNGIIELRNPHGENHLKITLNQLKGNFANATCI